ncbi:radical SAM protein [Amycolatopsis pigmentata]|uniref:Radical SAM protein n=1 Tax=Amycolatopsis pigmentata TaxID=450801 RepID=A0ABW5G0U2_9PSEU
MRQPSLTLIVKTSSACNMACSYCDADIYSRRRMPFEVLASLTAKALGTGRPAQFIWHGGEPLLLGQEFYRKALWLQEHYRRENQFVSNSIQTNATLLNDEWIDIFDDGNFSVGVSLDGPAELHDSNRVLRNGTGTFHKAMRGISLLKARNQRFGVLAVVTEETIKLGARKFFDFYLDNGLTDIALLSLKPVLIKGGKGHLPRESSSHSEFVNDIFDIWYEMDDPGVHIRDFESIMRVLLGGEHSICLLAGQCIGQDFAINFNGDFYHCDEFMTDSDYRLGNIVEHDMKTLLEGSRIKALIKSEEANLRNLTCNWKSVCNGGCPKDRYVAARLGGGGPVLCCGYANLIEHISARIIENPQVARLKLGHPAGLGTGRA